MLLPALLYPLILLITTTTQAAVFSPLRPRTPDPQHLVPRVGDISPSPTIAIPIANKRAPGAIPADQAGVQQMVRRTRRRSGDERATLSRVEDLGRRVERVGGVGEEWTRRR